MKISENFKSLSNNNKWSPSGDLESKSWFSLSSMVELNGLWGFDGHSVTEVYTCKQTIENILSR